MQQQQHVPCLVRGLSTHDDALKNVKRAVVGNAFVAAAKVGAAFWTGWSPSILGEAIHTLIDTFNQGLLLMGVKYSQRSADLHYNFGYGRATFVYSLISACSLLFVGAGVTAWHGLHAMVVAPVSGADLTPYGYVGWGVMGLSFAVDAWVLQGAMRDVHKSRPAGVSFLQHCRSYPDPAMRAIILEDLIATSGAIVALGGMGLTEITGNPIYDGVACLGVGGLMGIAAIYLIQWNKAFLMGKAVDEATSANITAALAAFPSVESITDVKSRWEGPETFAYQCVVDFDGRVLADKHLKGFKDGFLAIAERPVSERDALLAEALRGYGEEVVCCVESEVAEMHAKVREIAPQAEWVEILPRTQPHLLPKGGKPTICHQQQ